MRSVHPRIDSSPHRTYLSNENREGAMKLGANLGFVVALSCVTAVIVFCAQPEGQWKGSMTMDKNGVTIVRNPKEPLYRGNVISLEEELKITGGEGEQAFRDLVSIAVDGDGRIYLLDGKAANIKVCDRSGRFLKIVGRRGQGPGEFGRPERLAITPHKEIMVSDPGRSLIHFLDMEGHYLRQLPQNSPFFSGPKFLSSGAMVASYSVFGEDFKTILCQLDKDMKPVFTYTTIPLYKPPKVHIFLYMFVYDLQWDIAPNDEVVWGAMTTPEYEIYVHDARGKIIRKIIKDYTPIDLTGDEYKKLMKAWFGRPPASGQFEFIVPREYPPFHTFMVDSEGRIFVRRFEAVDKGERLLCEVFDSQGRYITDIVFPEKIIPMLFHDGRLYTREEDEQGYLSVKRYKLKSLPGGKSDGLS